MRKKYRIIKVNRYKNDETGSLEDYSIYKFLCKDGLHVITLNIPSIEVRIMAIERYIFEKKN